MQPIIARPRPILVFTGLSQADLSSADQVFADLSFADLVSAPPILAARFIVSPAFARPRFVNPIFGSHVSKDYSRKSRFDKSSKHFFRETFRTQGTPAPSAPRTWSLGSKANHACPRFWWWNPRHECFVRSH
jgi:hypothetical protein